MTPELWRDVEAVLAAVLALPEEEQSEYLDGVCVGAPELRREVESLLASEGDRAPSVRGGDDVGEETKEIVKGGPLLSNDLRWHCGVLSLPHSSQLTERTRIRSTQGRNQMIAEPLHGALERVVNR